MVKLFIILFLSTIYSQTIINIPGDYNTIQGGINAASDGDEVRVGPGAYTENLVIESDITLTSIGGASSTSIVGTNGSAGAMGSAITIRPQSGSAVVPQNIEIDGFEITGGSGNLMTNIEGDQIRMGGGIMSFNAPVKLKNNNIRGNGTPATSSGGGISIVSSAEDWDFNDRWEANPELQPVNVDLDLSSNKFYGNDAQIGHTIMIEGYENNDIDLTNGEFDCYSSDYQGVSDYWVKSNSNLNYEGSQGVQEAILSDVWVDPVDGSDENNSTGSMENPFKTIDFALSMVYATETNPITIHLSSGNFSPESGEVFPIVLLSNINIQGEDQDGTILNANQTNRVILIPGKDNVRISDLTITGGLASMADDGFEGDGGAGIFSYLSNNLNLQNLTITENVAYDRGGGIFLSGYGPGMSGHIDENNCCPVLNNLTISNNIGSRGGGLCIWNQSPILTDVIITENHASEQTYSGVFRGRGGGVYNNESVAAYPAKFVNVIVDDNTSDKRAGGIYVRYFCTDFTNTTIVNNISYDNNAGGLFLSYPKDCESNFVNTIIWGNSPSYIPYDGQQDKVSFEYSNVEGGWEGEGGQGNIEANPLFSDFDNGDYSLQEESPCIDSGTADVDGDGQIDITDYSGSAPDMGALEYDQGLNGDVNGDNIIDIRDVVALVFTILGTEDLCMGDCDYNNDGQINIVDIIAIVNHIID